MDASKRFSTRIEILFFFYWARQHNEQVFVVCNHINAQDVLLSVMTGKKRPDLNRWREAAKRITGSSYYICVSGLKTSEHHDPKLH